MLTYALSTYYYAEVVEFDAASGMHGLIYQQDQYQEPVDLADRHVQWIYSTADTDDVLPQDRPDASKRSYPMPSEFMPDFRNGKLRSQCWTALERHGQRKWCLAIVRRKPTKELQKAVQPKKPRKPKEVSKEAWAKMSLEEARARHSEVAEAQQAKKKAAREEAARRKPPRAGGGEACPETFQPRLSGRGEPLRGCEEEEEEEEEGEEEEE